MKTYGLPFVLLSLAASTPQKKTLPTSCLAEPESWTPMASLPPQVPRNLYFGPTAAWSGKEMFVLARREARPCTPALGEVCSPQLFAYAYNRNTDSWRELPAPPLSTTSASVWTGDRWILLSDTDGDSGAVFDPQTELWSHLPVSPLEARVAAAVAWAPQSNEILVWGGADSLSEEATLFADGAAYNPKTNSWRMLPPSPLSPRVGATWAAAGPDMVLTFGGRIGVDAMYGISGAARYDPIRDLWQIIPDPRVAKRVRNIAKSMDQDFALFWGGVQSYGDGDAPILKNGAIFDALSHEWTATAPLPPDQFPGEFMHIDAVWTSQQHLWIWGGSESYGSDEVQNFGQEMSRFNIHQQQWNKVPVAGLSRRYEAAVVWTGCEAIIFGGRYPWYTPLHDGMVFKP